MRRRSTVIAAASVALLVLVGAGVATAAGGDASGAVHQVELRVPGVPEPDGRPVTLDATLFLPGAAGSHPAVLLAHGFGGSKSDLSGQAQDLARQGYVVLTYTARGFGLSGGLIHLDSPSYEVADAQRMLDLLGRRPEVLKDGPDDPRVGVAGGSYGGGLTLLLAGIDRRVDAIAPQITWHDLRQALFPQFALNPAADLGPGSGPGPETVLPSLAAASGGDPSSSVQTAGVFKKAWAAVFFGPGGVGAAPAAGPGAGDPALSAAAACGRLAPELCSAYQQVAATGRPTAQILDLLWASSPARFLAGITAPTLLIQGEADSLFPLSEGEANAAGIAAHHVPVKVVWEGGGHDGGLDESSRLQAMTLTWFNRYLKRDGSAPDTRFEVTVPNATLSSQDTNPAPQIRTAAGEPGVTDQAPVPLVPVPLSGRAQVIVSPPGGSPAALTTLPGLGSALALAGGLGGTGGGTGAGGTGGGTARGGGAGGAGGLGVGSLSALPTQAAVFVSSPLDRALHLAGSGRVAVDVTSSTGSATLFAQLYDVAPGGQATLPEQLVTPVFLTDLPAAGRKVAIVLPAVVHDVAAGHRLRLVLSATDQGYALPVTTQTYRIALGSGPQLTLPVPVLAGTGGGGLAALLPWAFGLLGVLLLGAVLIAVHGRRSRRAAAPDPELAEVPVAIRGLGKTYRGGVQAVTDLSFRVESGWVLGLLGPNGAGKTTALRMTMGLIRPSQGEIRVFGHPVTPGAPVLSRVGSFVEGPGFLPHLSGHENLRLFWLSTGRPLHEARIEEALEVAGLGDDLQRTVRTYSQGMRQRLAIAQAMLGLPDLLLLDEPTNGLDPPQIREMREVLGRYAATGRTVVVSSHLLGEVEQTCTHVVVMHLGRLVAQGPVAELVGAATGLVVDVDDPERAAEVAAGIPGSHDVTITPTGLALTLTGTPRSELVRALVAAGLQVDRIAPRRGLEEAFLALVGEG